ncbi:MAG: hypothetical protein HYR89_04570 [Actinobacteria bacterium]|nr:hypothetical protein [Actinomycetota bacterium]
MSLPPRQRLPLALLGALLLFVPALAAAAGVRAQPIENHPLAPRPSIGRGWDAVDDVVPFANDHLALRDRAIRLDTWVDEQVFGDNPASGQDADPKVLVGDDGWLFLAEDLTKACRPAETVATALANVDALHDALGRHGKRLVFLIAPDKTTFMDDRLRSSPGLPCARRFKADLWRRLATRPPRGYVDLRRRLDAESSKTGEFLYHRADTHWNDRAAVVATRAVVELIDPGLWTSSTVVRLGDVARTGDLARMLGSRSHEQAPHLGIRRNVTRTVRMIRESKIPDSPEAFEVINEAGPNTPLVPGRAVFLYDSFGAVLYPFLSTYFANIEGTNHLLMPPEATAERIAHGDTVIYEVVERHLIDQLGDSDYWRSVLTDLERRLGAGAMVGGP